MTYPANRPIQVLYWFAATSQAAAYTPAFTRSPSRAYLDASHGITPSASGDWSDVGYVHSITRDPHYLSKRVEVEVRDPISTLVIGRGYASCVNVDQRP
jgi:hypothetical protein